MWPPAPAFALAATPRHAAPLPACSFSATNPCLPACPAPCHARTPCRPAAQIGLFAVPFITIVGWVLGHPFSLGFDPFAALVLLLSVMHSAHMINDAESHWLEGLQLIVTYFIIAVAYALSS